MPGQIYFSLLNPAIAATFAAMFLALWRRWQFQRHLLLLAGAFLLAAIGFAVYDLAPLADDSARRLVSNACFVGAITMACLAAFVRAGVQVPMPAFVLTLIACALSFNWFLFVDNQVTARIVIMGLTLALLASTTVFCLLKAGPSTTADRLIVLAAAVCIILSILRPALTLIGFLSTSDAASFSQSSYWITVQAFSPILFGMVALLFLAAMSIDTFDQLRAEANHDYLTGLLNRRGFEAAVVVALASARTNRPVLVMADIDNFKLINDSFGHKVGDQVIAGIARALSSHANARLVARVGGEEFALYYDDHDSAKLHRHAEDIRAAVRRISVPGLPPNHPLTVSMGMHGRRANETLSEMLIEADRALYRAKTSGKDRAVNSAEPLRRSSGTRSA